jgi:hypothetical protein
VRRSATTHPSKQAIQGWYLFSISRKKTQARCPPPFGVQLRSEARAQPPLSASRSAHACPMPTRKRQPPQLHTQQRRALSQSSNGIVLQTKGHFYSHRYSSCKPNGVPSCSPGVPSLGERSPGTAAPLAVPRSRTPTGFRHSRHPSSPLHPHLRQFSILSFQFSVYNFSLPTAKPHSCSIINPTPRLTSLSPNAPASPARATSPSRPQ